MTRYDAIVVGAGPAGSASAIGLARVGYRVALVERAEFPRRKVCGEFISATSIPVLDHYGIGKAWRAMAGPEVRRVGLFAGDRVITADMPRSAGFGRALGRDILDGLMLDAAVGLGVAVYQPFRAFDLTQANGQHVLGIASGTKTARLSAPILIAAHGSWERGGFPCTLRKTDAPGDLLGFKAHFRDAVMDTDLMPLLSFPGGYGGMVWADNGRLSLSCCMRRDVLGQIRTAGKPAHEAIQRHLAGSCRGIAGVLRGAKLAGPWLAAGPIQPGIRARYEGDIFRVGNIAGEAHPVIAEGISMAIQSSWLLAQALGPIDPANPNQRREAGRHYTRLWHRQFAGRIRAADAFARVAMSPEIFDLFGGIIQTMPSLLTIGARLSGKSKPLAQAQLASG